MKIKLPYWGIDSCTCGWFCAGLGKRGEYDCLVAHDIKDAHQQIKERGGKIALIDIPIGLPKATITRECDVMARERIGKRHPCVFPVLCREAMTAYREGDGDVEDAKWRADKKNRDKTGKSLSPPGWGIVPKIAEVDAFVQSDKQNILREVHPEVCFWALKGEPLTPGKKSEPAMVEERRQILNQSRVLPCDAWEIVQKVRREYTAQQVAKDDILDALAAAVTAKLGEANGYKTLPKNPPKDGHLPMEMVYVVAAPTR